VAWIPLHYQQDIFAVVKGKNVKFTPRSDRWIVAKGNQVVFIQKWQSLPDIPLKINSLVNMDACNFLLRLGFKFSYFAG
jgi:hypothetical protein